MLFRFKELLLAILLGFPSYSTFQLHYNYILNNYNIDDNEIITVNEVTNIWSNTLKHISFTSGNQV